jgi:phosphoglycerate kinase
MSSTIHSLLSSLADLNNAELQGKRVLHRVDLNLPLTQDRQVAEATRLTRILPTLQLLLHKGACVILCSHLGRPDPTTQALDELRKEFSLAPVAQLLQQQLSSGTFTGLVADCIGPAAVEAVAALQPGQVWSVETGCSEASAGATAYLRWLHISVALVSWNTCVGGLEGGGGLQICSVLKWISQESCRSKLMAKHL